MAPPRHVIGTAGHIDHGKTSLVKALTGIDTDRLPEEKERGITIELGFAHLTLPRHGVVGVVDVPGHERFVRTMVAGAVGIDLVVLVVAADEGVMPQTREHLDICALLGMRAGLVALSKCDAVDGELRELAALEVREALRGTFLATAPILPCSAKTGDGLPDLVSAIDELLTQAPGRDADGLLRLPVDRVFSMKGFGTIVTGTLFGGRLLPGDELVPLPGERGAQGGKVRGLQVHGQATSEALAGQRTAVNLALPKEALGRGETLVRPGTLLATERFDVRLRLLPATAGVKPLRRRARVLLHAGTTQRLAQITLLDRGELLPGQSALAQVQVQGGLALLPGDRFILRGFSLLVDHRTTLGGGQVLRTQTCRHRRGAPPLLAALLAVEGALAELAGNPAAASEALLLQEVTRVGVACVSLPELSMRLPLLRRPMEAALLRLCSARQIVSLPGRDSPPSYASWGALSLLQTSLLRVVAAHHEREPLSPGLSREALHSQLGPVGGDRDGIGEGRALLPSPRLLLRAIEGLIADGRLVADRDRVRLADHDPSRAAAARGLDSLGERLLALYKEAQLGPPRLEEAATKLSASPVEIKATLEGLLRSGALLRIKDLVFDRGSVAELRERLIAFLRAEREITPAQWKDLVGQSRKYSIPLAEYFDAERVTLRVGEVRRLRNSAGT